MARKKQNKKWDSYVAENGELHMICANSEEGGGTFGGKYWTGNLCYKYTPVSNSATGVVCPRCSRKLIDPPDIKVGRRSTGRPRGWQFMKEFVDKDGNVFHRGVEQPKLKGKLKPTIIKQKDRPTKKQKKRAINIALKTITELKKSLRKTTMTKKEKSKMEAQIRKLNRIASGKFPRNFNIVEFIGG